MNAVVRSVELEPAFTRIGLPVSVSRITVSGPRRLTLFGSQSATGPRGRTRPGGFESVTMRSKLRRSTVAMRYAHSCRVNASGRVRIIARCSDSYASNTRATSSLRLRHAAEEAETLAFDSARTRAVFQSAHVFGQYRMVWSAVREHVH